MVALNPYLTFDGDAAQAATFYGTVLGAEPEIMLAGDMPGGDPAAAHLVMHAQVLNGSGLRLYLADLMPGHESPFGENGAVSVSGPEAEEQQGYWDRLTGAEGSEIVQPLVDTPWGARFGMAKDPFGVLWLFNIEG